MTQSEKQPERVALWTRVSTTEQDVANQEQVLRAWAERHGLPVVKVYRVEGESAFTGKHRVHLDEALGDAHRGEFEVLAVWALDRLSREGVEQTLSLMRRFSQHKVRVVSMQEPWTDATGESNELLISIMAWVAQMESRRRSERIKAGLDRRRAEGKPVGRQPGAVDKSKRKRSGYIARWERERDEA